MNFAILYILSAFCVFYAKSDSISEFKAVADETTQNIVDYDRQLNTWILVTLSILKDTTTEALGESWKATFNLTDILTEKSKTKEEKDCIASQKSNLRQIIEGAVFKLDKCVRNSLEIGEPTRKNIQGAHQACIKIQDDLNQLKNTCGAKTEKQEECISLKVDELKSSLKGIQGQVEIYNIQAGTIKPRILSDVMHCNAKILTEIHESVTNIQETLKKCL
ncbi:uncharacterized protein LOC117180290 [Belonocnema kinseyi]|uniref:uncharacterized protein LOC117180290 n=1 Tax=Belonocnema kinseyi TaxID=2817044 RepID=UPI00143D9B7E|nr:uncharacterized protein LOC117180290 [Belonocnema kinseyi]